MAAPTESSCGSEPPRQEPEGDWTHVSVHERDEQPFDLERDPGEWTNLAGEHDTKEWREMILERFDADAIARATTLTAMRWDFDATKQYVR